MKTHVRGLVVPTQQYLATHNHVDKPVHEEYDYSRDRVARFLERRGFLPERQICGNLPFGFGLASSTALAFLHTSSSLSLADAVAVVHDCDREIHGFEPSGVDAAAISCQVPGFFSIRGWEDVQLSPLLYTLVFLPPERTLALVEIERRMDGPTVALTRIADAMTRGVKATGTLDYGALIDYSHALFEASVYSNVARSFVATLLGRGIAAKAIGGLYDKAILVVWPDEETAGRNASLLNGHRCSPYTIGLGLDSATSCSSLQSKPPCGSQSTRFPAGFVTKTPGISCRSGVGFKGKR